ncbi:MAG: DUF4037 domain-containing protein [Chloroflexota bacterium]|nr:DUF4037 domain-containing protein [Chloroflexota bacterium]
MQKFVPGVELSRRYWHEVVRPIVDDLLPGVPRAAARIGAGSDVLGFDTERSADHGWGPRVTVLFDDGFDLSRERRIALLKAIDARIPVAFLGYPTRFAASEGGTERHQAMLTTVREWFTLALGFDPRREITDDDWLATPAQLLLEATAGAVFEDPGGGLTSARERLRWYPDDVWLYLMACQWRRIDQEEPFVGRTGEVGDDLGSALVTARLVRDLMRLCFLMERQYAPYIKWLGPAFAHLKCAGELSLLFERALRAASWKEREAALVPAVESVARAFNALAVAEPQDPKARYFYNRPFLVLESSRFVEACMDRTPLSRLGYVGGIDQFVDSTDVLSRPAAAQRIRAFIAGHPFRRADRT